MANVVLANDHAAVELALTFVKHLTEKGYTVNHLGVTSTDSVDYPDMAELACNEFKKGSYAFGVLMCGTGIGMSISANKIEGIRCALPQDIYAAEMARKHNDVNFIAFGGRVKYHEDPCAMLDAFIDATFEGDFHQRRVEKVMALENHC